MQRILLLICMICTIVRISLAVTCDTNPCQLAGDFLPPNYQCLQATDNINNVICTCPDGYSQINTRCRICDTINCGSNGVCIERSFFENLYYACGCTNATQNFLHPGPCPNANPITTTISPIGICLNGGVYNSITGTCICASGFTGTLCEMSAGQTTCQNVVCANGGVCNPIPSTENGVEMQCLCLNGIKILSFAGANCELIGTPGRCTSGLCQNGGICEERLIGSAVYAYCRCPPGITGQCCQTPYFTCPMAGVYADPINCKFGGYFQCVGYALTKQSCPRGLRYNFMTMRCDVAVSCPP
ncbi:unnamed protein product [Adineta steineri]|uniref:Uncharacterized protein n=2 Tax=Adineta steineri TaxID=433720 RepID=A0A813ZLF9_9BILA|nr:unnamed protein product [Adineta steineri]CAF3510170.1 unnamed protein product [Adineta steineri]